ncbi:MAG: caspase family protein, partial [Desulfobacterales bacterium]
MILRKFTVLVLFLSLLWSSVALFAQERGIKLHVERLALVIGNSAYQTASLKNPLNDAEDMAATLRKLGFKV